MTWKIRHQGSPRSIEGLQVGQVVEGLQEGLWEPTDEVMGPQDNQWVPLESHPQLAEVVADLEPPAHKGEHDETTLDMNPLIDVALVLLIFFILTTSYAALQKVLDMPTLTANDPEKGKKITVVSPDQVKKFTIRVEAREENGQPVIKVEDRPVEEQYLRAALSEFVRDTQKTEILIDAQGVPWGTVVAIQDAAKGAGVQRAHLLKKPDSPR